jgi:hypothetical protein
VQPEVSPPSSDDSSGRSPSPAATADPNLNESEVRELDDMVHANRVLWPEEEFVNLTAEVVYLEADLAICAASLDVLSEFQLEQLRQGQFPTATMIIGKVRDLPHIGKGSPQSCAHRSVPSARRPNAGSGGVPSGHDARRLDRPFEFFARPTCR